MYYLKSKKDAIFKYDWLEEILCQKESNDKAFKQLLLMFIGSGYSEIVKNDYPEIYEELLEKIELKKLLTKKG